MSDAAEKPFEPTPQRIAKAKREGNVARSSELGANVAFAGAIAACAAIAAPLAFAARHAIALAAMGAFPVEASLRIVAYAVVPIGVAAIAGTVAAIAQSGGVAFVPPAPKAQRLDPVEGFKRMLSRETAAHTLRGALAFVLAASAAGALATGALAQLLRAQIPAAAGAAAWAASQRIAWAACAVGAAFAVAEYGAARRSWLRKLRMSFDERKRELKEQEGDPAARARRRALARSIVVGSMRSVPKAAFVVANPTHVAVALEYRPPEIPVPRVLVRAAEAAALRVRAIASAHGVPVIENVALARALFDRSRPGEPIPYALYVGVAEVVTSLIREGLLP